MLIFQSLTLVLIMDLKRNFIDAVIAWVDGSESKLNKKRNQYLNLSLKQQIPELQTHVLGPCMRLDTAFCPF